ncbi:MAG: class I SAM-dependent methyltransferase [Gammaproteobacteria bacterium]|nr:class I SAM-dependent methyltransferase [Gammaproteobacteria bacterium]
MATAPTNRARDRGSRTAEIVAVSRARHLLRHGRPYVFEDPFAKHFVGDRWRRVIGSRVLDALFSKVLVRKLMPITTQHLTRARFAEECLEEAVGRGVTQYVILGSGFDSFVFRRPDLGLTVFEVDLAATIDLKRERLAAAGMTPPDTLQFVPIDFEKDDLRTELVAAGLDTARVTFFNWMGVSYYLTESAILDNLARLAAIGGPGAEVVLDYLIAAECVPPEDRALFSAMMAFVGKRGEPMISRFAPAEAGTVLNPSGLWDVVRNESPAEHRRRYLGERADVPPLAPITWSLHLRRRASRTSPL